MPTSRSGSSPLKDLVVSRFVAGSREARPNRPQAPGSLVDALLRAEADRLGVDALTLVEKNAVIERAAAALAAEPTAAAEPTPAGDAYPDAWKRDRTTVQTPPATAETASGAGTDYPASWDTSALDVGDGDRRVGRAAPERAPRPELVPNTPPTGSAEERVMANECIPLYRPGGDLTATVGAGGVVGKTFVNISAAVDPAAGTLATVVTATAAGLTSGVAAFDTAVGGKVAMIRTPGAIVPVTAGGTIAVGAEVEVGSGGKAVTLASGKARGRAWTAGTNNADVFVELY